MRAVVQRVSESSVTVSGKMFGKIGKGLTVFLGMGEGDKESDVEYLARKIAGLRIFEDVEGKMNFAVKDIQGEVLAVPQFTLYGDARKGMRPSFSKALPPGPAEELYNLFCKFLRDMGIPTEEGVFRAHMMVHIENDGPVTILLDSRKEF